MKKLATISFWVFSNLVISQNIHGVATYQLKSSTEEFNKQVLSDPNMDPVMRKFIESKMNSVLNKTYELEFDQANSVYREAQKVDINRDTGNSSWSPYGLNNAYYKFLTSKILIIEKDLMGKIFNVIDSLPQYNWKTESQTKKIGNYECYKAVAIIPVSNEDRADYEREKTQRENGKTNFLDVEEPKAQVITVWYAPEVPIIQGPEKYWGLPGLILEVDDGSNIILCSKIIINSKVKKNIRENKHGKSVSSKEFEEISNSKLLELKKKTTLFDN